jgi:hypothetical protein
VKEQLELLAIYDPEPRQLFTTRPRGRAVILLRARRKPIPKGWHRRGTYNPAHRIGIRAARRFLKALRGARVTITRPTWGRVEIEYVIL